jgi:hypothetical protein
MAKRKTVQSFEARRDQFLEKHGAEYGLGDAYQTLTGLETPEDVAEALDSLIKAMQKYVESIPAGQPDRKTSSGFFCAEIVVDAATSLATKPNLCSENVKKIFWKALRSGGFLHRAVNQYAQNRIDPFKLFNKFNDSLNKAFLGQGNNPPTIDTRMTERLRELHR